MLVFRLRQAALLDWVVRGHVSGILLANASRLSVMLQAGSVFD